MTIAGVVTGIGQLAFCTGVLAVGKFALGFGIEALRTLTFAALMFGSQATICAVRERRHLWSSHPSGWRAASSVIDVLIAVTLAVGGIAMAPLPALVVAGTLAAATAFAFPGRREGATICPPRDWRELLSIVVDRKKSLVFCFAEQL